jgi:hypothetical protein
MKKQDELKLKTEKELLIELINETATIRRNVQFFFYLMFFGAIVVIGLRFS